MCDPVWVGERELFNVAEVMEYFGLTTNELVSDEAYKRVDPSDPCLCPLDVPATLAKVGVAVDREYPGAPWVVR
ncbi:MAG: hypothetical protein IPH13_20245 [Planctomycetes bacterium]|nr:hypothetical protein [Planctomycetota bacterium]